MAAQYYFGYFCDIVCDSASISIQFQRYDGKCDRNDDDGRNDFLRVNHRLSPQTQQIQITNNNKNNNNINNNRNSKTNNNGRMCNTKNDKSESAGNFVKYALSEFSNTGSVIIRKSVKSFRKCMVSTIGLVGIIFILSLEVGAVYADTNSRQNFHGGAYGVSDEFTKYAIVKPTIIQHSRHKRDITSTQLNSNIHPDKLTLKYVYGSKDVIIDLDLNENLTPKGHFLRYQASNGDKIVQNLTKTDIDLCHYKGTIRNNDKSHVAISTCYGINGVIFDDDETYYIKSKPNGTVDSEHFLYRHSDMQQTARCGYEGGINKTHDIDFYKNSMHNTIKRFKRSSSADTIIRGPYNANKHSSFVELVLVIDNKIYKALGENLKRVHNHCIEIANIINALYVPLNIFIALVGVVVWNENNEVELSSDGDKTLKNFLQYRRKVLVKDHPNDNAQLLTKEQFEGGVVGKALKGPICTYEFSGGVSMDHSQIVSVVATTVAHEMGHNFGMEHDDKDCKCVDERCIMSASSSSVAPRHWSSCSVDQLNLAFHQGMNYCLRNKPIKLFDSPQCGNGFVEPGEQCDCGLPEFCENTCCDPHTCMLHSNASCATGTCCDLTTCHPRTAGTICRTSAGECDLPEYCTGESEYCPEDYFKRDTEVCDGSKAFCYQGTCRSRDDQCKVLWGPSGKSSDPCYEKNLNGTRHGNCGYDRLANIYMNCSREDIFCGMLQCRHLNERLEFGMESVAVLSHSYIPYGGIIIPCRTAIVDLGLQNVDPGLVPNGAKCAEDKMCVNQKCLSIESLWATGMAPACPEGCSGHGICNNKGHCHCDMGFGPPLCNVPGPGGSDISGPATNPNDGHGFARIMYVFFLGVVPFISLVLLAIYYWRQNRPALLRKSTKPTVLKSTTAKKSPQRSNGGSSTSPSVHAVSTPSSTDDMNSALLRSNDNSDPSSMNNNMFGHFKGFTLKPLPISRNSHVGAPNVAFVHPVSKSGAADTEHGFIPNGIPIRSAPPVPKTPNIMRKQSQIKPMETTTHQIIDEKLSTEAAPALPPLNPGSIARPIISSPILEASTCSAKELISPLKHTTTDGFDKIPQRQAPAVPSVKFEQPAQNKIEFSFKNSKDSAIKRIASFLKKDDNNKTVTNTLPRNKSKPIIDREKLKTIDISSPMPSMLSKVEPGEQEKRPVQVTRAQSMRDPSASVVVKRSSNAQTFGSLRQPLNKTRPGSMIGSRPKSPPPRPPAPPSITSLKIPGVPGYQNPPPPKKCIPLSNEYDDCEAVEAPLAGFSEDNSPTNSDNIYSVIDEYQNPQPAKLTLPEKDSNTGGSMGLLGEIVNEIENRNLNSIYSVSTLSRKKPDESESPYVNTSDTTNEYSGSEYMNMKSNASTTSSGYLKPSVINTPIARIAPVKLQATAASAESDTSNVSSFRNRKNDDESKDNPILHTFQQQKRPNIDITAKNDDEKSKLTSPVSKSKFSNKTTSAAGAKTNFIVSTSTVSSSSAKPSSPSTVRKTPLKPNISSNSIRGRSPSPSSVVSTHRPATIKPSTTSFGTTTASSKVKNLTNNVPAVQKPKPLAKPVLPSTDTKDKTTPAKWQSSTKSANNNQVDSTKSGAAGGSGSKFSGQRGGKSSNIASLQKRFESSGFSQQHP